MGILRKRKKEGKKRKLVIIVYGEGKEPLDVNSYSRSADGGNLRTKEKGNTSQQKS